MTAKMVVRGIRGVTKRNSIEGKGRYKVMKIILNRRIIRPTICELNKVKDLGRGLCVCGVR